MPYNVDTFIEDVECDVKLSEKLRQLNDCYSNTSTVQSRMQTKDTEINTLKDEIGRCIKSKNELETSHNKLRKDYEAMFEQATTQQHSTTTSNDQVMRLQTMLRTMQGQFNENNKQYITLQQNYNKLVGQYDELKNSYKQLADEHFIKCYDYKLSVRTK